MIHAILDSGLQASVSGNLDNFPQAAVEDQKLKQAAVAVVLVNASEDPGLNGLTWSESDLRHAAVLLTRRSARLNKHAGQWALPGGRIDAGETPVVAAIRELHEEVGLELDHSHVLGQLDAYPTRSGFNITPVILWGGDAGEPVANPDEVASIHRIPVRELLREDAPILENIPESEHPVLKMPIGNSWIAAPTAAVLYQFREVALLGKHTRVAHFEQPYFAWR